jgi:GNAT superfamily N-acetyltransferase
MISGLREDAIAEHAGARPSGVRGPKSRNARYRADPGLINGYAAKGIMLPRTELEVSEDIRDFSVIVAAGRLVGCGALHFYTPSIGEIRSLAVAEDAKTHGIGRRLIEALVREASGLFAGRGVRIHLRGGLLRQDGFSGSGARRTAAEGLEGLRALPEVPVLRRDRGHARAAAGVL